MAMRAEAGRAPGAAVVIMRGSGYRGRAERCQAPGPTRSGWRMRAAGSAHAETVTEEDADNATRRDASTATSAATSSALGVPRTMATGTTESSEGIRILIFLR